MQRIYDCSDSSELLTGMRQAKLAVGRGELVVLPTDTVYGIGADAFNPKAVQALLDAKGRGRSTPPPVLIGDVSALDALATDIPDVARVLTEQYWPGPLTLVMHAQPSLNWDLGETKGTVGLRIPDSKEAVALLKETGPMAVSSANLHGKPSAINAQQAFEYFDESVPVYLDAGEASVGVASTILDLTDAQSKRIRVLRQGALKLEDIKKLAGDFEFESVI
ncbi:MAG: L-threonylcarbamoyladenylate synthase [Microbacteriaceae bacterium]|nr:L-threonylcarbamoyladenylate synthase [Microbacteriaceae bacterium]MDR9443781.1 L-threonylcarbamoyladenylate synthase [Microbacteriaceae bacterium]